MHGRALTPGPGGRDGIALIRYGHAGQNVNSYRDASQGADAQSLTLVASAPGASHLSRGFRTIYRPREGGLRFADLLDRVADVDPDMRIRFTSPHPKDFPDELLALMRERPNVCKVRVLKNSVKKLACARALTFRPVVVAGGSIRPWRAQSIHLPAQSGSTAVLERMRRGYTREAYLDLVHRIRECMASHRGAAAGARAHTGCSVLASPGEWRGENGGARV